MGIRATKIKTQPLKWWDLPPVCSSGEAEHNRAKEDIQL